MGELQLKKIKELLNQNHIKFQISEHKPVYTSEEAAEIRGVELNTGVKALILKTNKNDFIMGLIAADKRINLKKLAKIVGVKKIKLTTADEVLKKTGCEIGSVHPFGNILKIPTFMDVSVTRNKTVNFNAGLHTVSIKMRAEDLVKIVKPTVRDFSEIEAKQI